MKYDFTTIMQRKGRDATAYDALGSGGSAPDAPKEGFDVIPMWVADMNFPTLHTIADEMKGIAALDLGHPQMLDTERPSEVKRVYDFLNNPVVTSLPE